MEILERTPQPENAFVLPPDLVSRRASFVEKHGCSSPHLPWEKINDREDPSSEKLTPGPLVTDNFLRQVESKDVLAVHDLITEANANCSRPSATNSWLDTSDPSTYVSMATAWEVIMRADQCMRHIFMKCRSTDGALSAQFPEIVDQIVATAISSLSEVGAPSWGLPSSVGLIHGFWRSTFPPACEKVLRGSGLHDFGCDGWISAYARLSILRAAYYTIMMRAARDIRPGLTEESSIDTALAYMA